MTRDRLSWPENWREKIEIYEFGFEQFSSLHWWFSTYYKFYLEGIVVILEVTVPVCSVFITGYYCLFFFLISILVNIQ